MSVFRLRFKQSKLFSFLFPLFLLGGQSKTLYFCSRKGRSIGYFVILVIWKCAQSTKQSFLLFNSFFFLCQNAMTFNIDGNSIHLFFSHHRFYTHNNFSHELLLNFSFDCTCYIGIIGTLAIVHSRFVRCGPCCCFFTLLFAGMIWTIVSYIRFVKHICVCLFQYNNGLNQNIMIQHTQQYTKEIQSNVGHCERRKVPI